MSQRLMTKRWWLYAEPLYRRFNGTKCGRDHKEAQEMFIAETFGGYISPHNRYAIGKRGMDITVSMWRKDIHRGLLLKFELLDEPSLRGLHVWLNKLLPRMVSGTHALRRNT